MNNMKLNLSVNNSIFDNNSHVIGTINEIGNTSMKTVLSELDQIKSQLNSIAQLNDIVVDLRNAIDKGDKKTVSKLVSQLSTGTLSSLFANFASEGLKKFLGL